MITLTLKQGYEDAFPELYPGSGPVRVIDGRFRLNGDRTLTINTKNPHEIALESNAWAGVVDDLGGFDRATADAAVEQGRRMTVGTASNR